ncbi:UNVERIFIED_CONTAM: hypothetical protein FKN15_041899 [Acipenser sinensis]
MGDWRFCEAFLYLYIESLLSVHDTVAQKSYDPELPPLPDDIDDDEDSVKIIRLVKNKEPLGATIKRDENTGAVVVARIMRGGAADRSGLIHVGDELREVNGIPVEDKKPEEIIHILAQSQGAITFKIIPGINEDTSSKEPKLNVGKTGTLGPRNRFGPLQLLLELIRRTVFTVRNIKNGAIIGALLISSSCNRWLKPLRASSLRDLLPQVQGLFCQAVTGNTVSLVLECMCAFVEAAGMRNSL